MSYDSWLEGPYQRMVEQGEAEMLAREEAGERSCPGCGNAMVLDQDADSGECFYVCLPCARTADLSVAGRR